MRDNDRDMGRTDARNAGEGKTIKLDAGTPFRAAWSPDVERQGNEILHAGQGRPVAENVRDLPDGGIEFEVNKWGQDYLKPEFRE